MCALDFFADLASILTAAIAAGVAVAYWCDRRLKRKRLEEYLKKERQKKPDNHSHTVVHLMAKLGMTEAEIIHASFASKHVVHKVRQNYETGLASQLLFAYSDEEK